MCSFILNSKKQCFNIYLDLALGHSQGICESSSLWTGQIFGLLEGFLQGEDLLSWESWPGVFLLAILVQHHVCLNWRKMRANVQPNKLKWRKSCCFIYFCMRNSKITSVINITTLDCLYMNNCAVLMQAMNTLTLTGHPRVSPGRPLHHPRPEDRRPPGQLRQGFGIPGHGRGVKVHPSWCGQSVDPGKARKQLSSCSDGSSQYIAYSMRGSQRDLRVQIAQRALEPDGVLQGVRE